MKTAGLWVTIVGVVTAVTSFLMKTSVGTSGSPYLSEGVLNLGLLQNQMMVFQAGLAAAVAGIVLFSAGALEEATRAQRSIAEVSTPSKPAPAEPVVEVNRECEWCDQSVKAPAQPCSNFTLDRLAQLPIEGDRCQEIVAQKLAEVERE